jgi:hypothetical protein
MIHTITTPINNQLGGERAIIQQYLPLPAGASCRYPILPWAVAGRHDDDDDDDDDNDDNDDDDNNDVGLEGEGWPIHAPSFPRGGEEEGGGGGHFDAHASALDLWRSRNPSSLLLLSFVFVIFVFL